MSARRRRRRLLCALFSRAPPPPPLLGQIRFDGDRLSPAEEEGAAATEIRDPRKIRERSEIRGRSGRVFRGLSSRQTITCVNVESLVFCCVRVSRVLLLSRTLGRPTKQPQLLLLLPTCYVHQRHCGALRARAAAAAPLPDVSAGERSGGCGLCQFDFREGRSEDSHPPAPTFGTSSVVQIIITFDSSSVVSWTHKKWKNRKLPIVCCPSLRQSSRARADQTAAGPSAASVLLTYAAEDENLRKGRCVSL